MIETSLQELPHGITLSCRTAGDKGRPVLMFLHGFPEAAFVWDVLLEHFAQPQNGGYRCVAPNLRGFERSSSPAEVAAYRAKFLVQDIAALIALETSFEEPQRRAAPSEAGPLGGQRATRSGRTWGQDFRRAAPSKASPLGGQGSTRSDERGGSLACLIAHDWGGAVAWNLAASQPGLMDQLAIINSPHPATFLRELQDSPAQQAASAYMNFLVRPDAEKLLAEDDYRRLWEFFINMGATSGPHAWLTESVKQQYRDVWGLGLHGGCNYYRASPLRPATKQDPAASAISFPKEMFTVTLPTLVLWALNDIALPPSLIEGLAEFVPQMQLERIDGATHWMVHEQPGLVIRHLEKFLA